MRIFLVYKQIIWAKTINKKWTATINDNSIECTSLIHRSDHQHGKSWTDTARVQTLAEKHGNKLTSLLQSGVYAMYICDIGNRTPVKKATRWNGMVCDRVLNSSLSLSVYTLMQTEKKTWVGRELQSVIVIFNTILFLFFHYQIVSEGDNWWLLFTYTSRMFINVYCILCSYEVENQKRRP